MEKEIQNHNIIETLYSDRTNYTVVALTGYSGTGCSRLANLMSKPFDKWEDIRRPNDLVIPQPTILNNDELLMSGKENHKSIAASIFARKYQICYDFSKGSYIPFVILKYSHALLFYSLNYWIHSFDDKLEDKVGEVKRLLQSTLKDKFRPSRKNKDDDYRESRNIGSSSDHDFTFASEGNGYYAWENIHTLENFKFDKWEKLIELFSELKSKSEGIERYKDQAKLFFKKTEPAEDENVFHQFVNSFLKYLWNADPYCTHFFFHRLGFVIRACGRPEEETNIIISSSENDGKYLYVIVKLINHLIKGYRHLVREKSDKELPTRIVIDKVRNSLEAKYLKERYSAFYFVAVHEEEKINNHLNTKIEKRYPSQTEIDRHKSLTAIQVRKIFALDSIERSGKDFEKGLFFSQNIGQCMADAEIHISNDMGPGNLLPYFYSMSEQWMKYSSLILHPGLITPSSEERCMVVAYTAKFNSGCLSRQVGAVITNKAHTIRSIGWNDVPYGQIPCSLRQIKVMAFEKYDLLKTRKFFYSKYELENVKPIFDGNTFNDKVIQKYETLHLGLSNPLMAGLPDSYCFKSLQNEFEGEKNQVHTRSLHAEENAILQMAKYGGEALQNGIIYVTASPCELCCKKLYQIGVRKIVYIDEYPGISRENIIQIGYHRPKLKQFQGAYGSTYFKLYQPLISYKDELSIRNKKSEKVDLREKLLSQISNIVKSNTDFEINNEDDLNKIKDSFSQWFENFNK